MWKSCVGSNHSMCRISRPPIPLLYTLVCMVYGCPVLFPKNSKSSSSLSGAASKSEHICTHETPELVPFSRQSRAVLPTITHVVCCHDPGGVAPDELQLHAEPPKSVPLPRLEPATCTRFHSADS